MKKRIFLPFFIVAHCMVIAAFINKKSQYLKLSYEKQKYEQTIKSLLAKKQDLSNQVRSLQNHQKIKTYATTHLHMEPLFLKNIKKLPKQKTSTS